MNTIDLQVAPEEVEALLKKVMEKITVRLSDPNHPNHVAFNYDQDGSKKRSTLAYIGPVYLMDEIQLQFTWSTTNR